MKISFDSLRKHIAADFNALVDEISYQDKKLGQGACLNLNEEVKKLRSSLGALMCCYDSQQMPDDFNDLSDKIELLEL